MMIMMVC